MVGYWATDRGDFLKAKFISNEKIYRTNYFMQLMAVSFKRFAQLVRRYSILLLHLRARRIGHAGRVVCQTGGRGDRPRRGRSVADQNYE